MARTTVVTGGAGALGAAVAAELVARGERVALLDRAQSEARAHELTTKLGPNVHSYSLDLASKGEWKSILDRVDREVGEPDGAVLVAGGWQGGTPFHAETDDAVWTAMMAANLETVHRSLRALLPSMVARGHGSIVVIGSRNAERPFTGGGASAYTAAKAAVVALAEAVAQEVLDRGVRINAVLPSTLDTAANRHAMPKADASRWVTTESCAKVIAFLLSDDARDISGAAIPVYGKS